MKKLVFLLMILSILPFAPVFSQESDTKEAESLFVAQKAFDDGFYDVALSLLERFSRNYPSSGRLDEVKLLIGRCYFQENRFLEALKQFEDLQSAQGKKINDAVLYWIAEVHFRGNNFARAGGYYKQLVDGYPASPYAASAYYSLGWCLCQQGSYTEALDAFKRLEAKFPGEQQCREAAFKIIECLYNLKEYGQLKTRLKAYIKENKDDRVKLAYLYYYLAEAEYYLDEHQAALDDYARAAQATDDSKIKMLADLGYAWSCVKLKRYEEAQKHFAAFNPEKLDKQYQESYCLGRAVLLYETGRFAESQQQYEKLKALASDPLLVIQASFGRADALYSRGDYAGAVAAYREVGEALAAQAQAPGELTDRLHHSLAWAYLKGGQFKEAIAEFQKIANQSDDKVFKVSALCQIGDAYQDAGDAAKARDTYENILKEFPGSFYGDYVQYQLGVVLIKLGDYDSAITNFLQMQKNFPESKLIDDAHYALGLAYFQKKEYASSRDIFNDFERDYKDSSLRVQARYLYGTSLFNLGEYERAIEVYKGIVREAAGDAEIIQKAEYEIADCYYQMGNEKEAMSRFNQLRVKYPDSSLSAEIMWWLGEYYYRKDDLNLAIRYFSSLIRDFPGNALIPNAYYALGSIYAEEGKCDEAIDNFQKVIGLSSSELGGQAVIAIADIYARQDKTESAVTEYRKAVEEYPLLAHIVYPKLGELFASQGRHEESLDCYRKSLDLVPLRELPEIHLRMAEVFQTLGRTEEAVEHYLKITYLFPENRELGVKAMLRVAKIREEQGKRADAVALYRKIAELNVAESKYAMERIESLQGKQGN